MNDGRFSTQQFDDAYPDDIGDHYWSRARNLVVHDAIRSASMPQKRWLEIGCGRGVVIDFLRRHDVLIDGVELANVLPLVSVRDFVRSGCDFLKMSQQERKTFAGVLLLDVIEHIEDSGKFLRSVRNGLPQAQTLIVTVPARPELWSNYDVYYGHYRRYTRASLRSELEEAGWKPLHTRYFFRALYPFGRLLLKMKGERPTSVLAPRAGLKPIHRFAATILWLESLVPLGAVRGTSLLAIAQRAR